MDEIKFEVPRPRPEEIAYRIGKMSKLLDTLAETPCCVVWLDIEDVGTWEYYASDEHTKMLIYTTLLSIRDWVRSHGYNARVGVYGNCSRNSPCRDQEGRDTDGGQILQVATNN